MSFIGQAAKVFEGTAEFKFQVVLFGCDAIYVEGAKPIKVDGDEMVFRSYGTVLTVTGSGLTVKELSDDCVSVVGKISGFSVKDL